MDDVRLVETLREHIPKFLEIFEEHKPQYFGGLGMTLEDFESWFNLVALDSVTAVDSTGRVLGVGFVDVLVPGEWASVHVVCRRRLPTREIRMWLIEGMKWFVRKHDLKQLVGVVPGDYRPGLYTMHQLGFVPYEVQGGAVLAHISKEEIMQ